MKTRKWIWGVLTLAWMASMATAQPAGPENPDRTLSPYFFVKSSDPGVDRLPLKATSAEVNIAGVIADVKVTQVYRNEGKSTLEAVYTFPASTRAAVYGMRMTVGTRTIVAEIRKREQARAEYEQARAEGKSASLLEQQRPNVFQMNVANILPGDEIKVELQYTELLVPTEGVYEFVYPTVVGPRYYNKTAQAAPESDKFVATPYLKEGEVPTYSFDIRAYISAGLPIQNVVCPTHKVKVDYEDLTSASVLLDTSEDKGGNRDYILRYQLAGGRIESGLLLYRGEKENFFLLMAQPPKNPSLDQIPPRDYIFIVDVSGSMHGFPLDISKKLLRDLLVNLRPTDTFNVLLFAGASAAMSEQPVPATPENVQLAVNLIDNQQGGGGTELLPALKRALSLPRPDNASRTVIIATDGYVAVEKESFDLIRSTLDQANFFAFGIGSGVNRFIIEGMARSGMGESFVVQNQETAPAAAEKFRKYVSSPALTHVKVDFGGFEAYNVEPFTVPDVLAERPVIVFGKWRGAVGGTITVKGITGRGPYTEAINVAEIKPALRNSALRYLWARHKIAELDDYNNLSRDESVIAEVTDLGLAYNLLTAYTSFVAVDTVVRAGKDGKPVTVQQALPLPAGVENTAVGFDGGVTNVKVGGSLRASFASAKLLASEAASKPAVVPVRLAGVSSQSAGVTSAAARKSVETKILSLQAACLEMAGKGWSGRGRVTVKVVVDRSGNVTSAEPVKSELRKEIGVRITNEIKKWRFDGLTLTKSAVLIIDLDIDI